jgi:urea transport system substrate-binding protein
MAHGYLDVYAWAAAVKKAGSFDPAMVRKAVKTLPYMDAGLGQTKFANDQSLIQTAYVGQLLPSGQFKILWQSKAPVIPVPYDPLSFPGKTCVL